MKNLFENAYFGKAYKTRSGQKAIYLFSSGCGVYCITEEFKKTIRYYSTSQQIYAKTYYQYKHLPHSTTF